MIYIIPTVQRRAWEENDAFKVRISDEINGDLFLLEEAGSVYGVRPEIGQS